MPTLPNSLGVTNPPLNTAGNPETLPYAIEGTVAEPSNSREVAGWVAGVIPPSSEENFMRQRLWQWMSRLSSTSAFTTRATVGLTIGGTPAVGDTLTISYNGNNNVYVVTSADVAGGTTTIATHWAQQIENDPLFRVEMDASRTGSQVQVSYKDPGVDFPLSVTSSSTGGTTLLQADVVGGTGMPLMITTALGGGSGLPLLHGTGLPTGAATKLQYYGDANGGALRSGNFIFTQADPANVGTSSLGVGESVSAFGDYSAATGNLSQASAVGSVAMGLSNLVAPAADASVAMGDGNTVSGTTSFAAGLSNNVHANSVSSLAIGYANVVTGTTQVALGNSNTISNLGHPSGVAIGDTNSLTNAGSSVAIGSNNTINNSANAAFALGTGHSVGQPYSTALGLNAKPANPGEVTIAAGQFQAPGDAQLAHIVVKALNTATSANYLVSDGATSTLTMPQPTAGGAVYSLDITIVAQWVSGSSGSIADKAYWKLSGVAFIASTGTVTLTGFAASPIAPTHSAGLGNQYRVNLSTAVDTLQIYGVTNNANATARFVGQIVYVNV